MSDRRDGQWIDEDGHCRVCDGEIPYGHTDNCEYFKLESQLTASQARVGELEQCLERERVLLKGLEGNLKACEEHNEELILEKRERVETVRKVSEALDAIDRNELLRERVELVKDKERLDWLQSTKPLMVAPMFPNDKWDIAIIESGNETHDSDVRAAIDAAIAKEKK